MGVVQSLASDLANHDWDQARTIYDFSESDDQLESDYGALNDSTVVITNESDDGSAVTLTGAYVAWETVNGSQRTSIYCVSWQVETDSEQVESLSNVDSPLIGYASAWVDPSTLENVVTGQCT